MSLFYSTSARYEALVYLAPLSCEKWTETWNLTDVDTNSKLITKTSQMLKYPELAKKMQNEINPKEAETNRKTKAQA